MKSILRPVFCIIVACGWTAHLLAQERTITPEEVMRRLGGDPDKARADAAKRALTMRTPEEEANDFRAMQMTATLTDNIIANISSSDPLLLSLYTNRIGTGSGVSNEHAWLSVVDRDIRRRPEAKDLFQTIFQTTNRQARRLYAMRWLARNPDVPWGNNIMEEAIKLYRADPSKWEQAEIRMLCELIRARGTESNLKFLDEINAKGIGDNGAAETIRRRLKADVKTHSPNESPSPFVSSSKVNQNADVKTRFFSAGEHSTSTSWSTVIIIVLAASCLFFWLFKKRDPAK